VARRLVKVDGGAIELLPGVGGGLDVVLRLRTGKPQARSVEPPMARPLGKAKVGASRKEATDVQDHRLGD
jgi:hypothetical protein